MNKYSSIIQPIFFQIIMGDEERRSVYCFSPSKFIYVAE